MNTKQFDELVQSAQPFQRIETVIHEKGRLAIVSVLATASSLTFTELRDVLGLTDGNLAAHLKPLQQAGYVRAAKNPRHGRMITELSLTARGRQELKRYINALHQIVTRHKK